jgi:Cys-tRNA(Pro)/Cys-tRNA(Cys) deacylase
MSTTPATQALDDMGVKYSLHKYTSTVERDFGLEASLRLNMNPQQVFKTILFTESNSFFVAVAPVDHDISTKKLANAVGVRTVRTASKEDAQRVTGYVLGGISPFGQKKAHQTVLDESAWNFASIYVSGGKRGLEIEIAPDAFTQVLGAIRAPIAARDS